MCDVSQKAPNDERQGALHGLLNRVREEEIKSFKNGYFCFVHFPVPDSLLLCIS